MTTPGVEDVGTRAVGARARQPMEAESLLVGPAGLVVINLLQGAGDAGQGAGAAIVRISTQADDHGSTRS